MPSARKYFRIVVGENQEMVIASAEALAGHYRVSRLFMKNVCGASRCRGGRHFKSAIFILRGAPAWLSRWRVGGGRRWYVYRGETVLAIKLKCL